MLTADTFQKINVNLSNQIHPHYQLSLLPAAPVVYLLYLQLLLADYLKVLPSDWTLMCILTSTRGHNHWKDTHHIQQTCKTMMNIIESQNHRERNDKQWTWYFTKCLLVSYIDHPGLNVYLLVTHIIHKAMIKVN